jgi:hypothetical protein
MTSNIYLCVNSENIYGKGYNFEIYTILFSSNLIYIFAIDCDKGFR